MTRHTATCFALAVSLLGEGATAQPLAPQPTPSQHSELAPPSRMWFDVGFYLRDSVRGFGQRGYWIAPDVGMELRANDVWSVELILPMSAGGQKYASTYAGAPSTSTGAVAALGNVTIAASRWLRLGEGTLRVGGLVALPSSMLVDEGFAQLAGASALRGTWNLWRYAPDTLAGVVHARYLWDRGRFSLGAEAALGALIGVGDLRSDGAFVMQVAVAPMWRVGERAGVGARLQGVYVGDDEGVFQASLVPFVRLAPGQSDLDLWFNLNLDEPYGWSFDGGVWGVGARLSFPL